MAGWLEVSRVIENNRELTRVITGNYGRFGMNGKIGIKKISNKGFWEVDAKNRPYKPRVYGRQDAAIPLLYKGYAKVLYSDGNVNS